MIRLRELQEKDAKFMLEWMHDKDIQKGFKKDMLRATLADAERFCAGAVIPERVSTGDSLNFAIVNDEDEYLGTISLKDIDLDDKKAEYAIVTRKTAHGKGIAFKATGLVLEKAFNEYGLHRVFLSVYADNKAAIKLYEKSGFTFEGEFRQHIKRDGEYVNWKWYGLLKDEFDPERFGIESKEN